MLVASDQPPIPIWSNKTHMDYISEVKYIADFDRIVTSSLDNVVTLTEVRAPTSSATPLSFGLGQNVCSISTLLWTLLLCVSFNTGLWKTPGLLPRPLTIYLRFLLLCGLQVQTPPPTCRDAALFALAALLTAGRDASQLCGFGRAGTRNHRLEPLHAAPHHVFSRTPGLHHGHCMQRCAPQPHIGR
jgi:hypothetical protein